MIGRPVSEEVEEESELVRRLQEQEWMLKTEDVKVEDPKVLLVVKKETRPGEAYFAEDPASLQRSSASQTSSKSFTIVPLSELVRRRDAGDVVPHFIESGVSPLCASSSISRTVLGLGSSEADGFFNKKVIAIYDF